MVHVNETIVIKSSSPKLAEWVKRLKAHKAEQLEKLRNVERVYLTVNQHIKSSSAAFHSIAKIAKKRYGECKEKMRQLESIRSLNSFYHDI